MGTSGNFSAVVSREPFRLAITASSAHKGQLRAGDVLQCDEVGAAVGRHRVNLRPKRCCTSRSPGAGGGRGVAHPFGLDHRALRCSRSPRAASRSKATRCSKGCTASDRTSTANGFRFSPTIRTCRGWRSASARRSTGSPRRTRSCLCRHGLYTWGDTLADAERHVEILEFLFETIGRTAQSGRRDVAHANANSNAGGGHGARENSRRKPDARDDVGDCGVSGRARDRVRAMDRRPRRRVRARRRRQSSRLRRED